MFMIYLACLFFSFSIYAMHDDAMQVEHRNVQLLDLYLNHKIPEISYSESGCSWELKGKEIESLDSLGYIPNVTELQSLNLAYNKITEIKPGCLNLPKLKQLDLTGNEIARIWPGAFDQLTSLRCLILDDNPLTYVDKKQIKYFNPQAIGNRFFTKLAAISLCENSIGYDMFKANVIYLYDLNHRMKIRTSHKELCKNMKDEEFITA